MNEEGEVSEELSLVSDSMIHTRIHQSHGRSHTMSGWVTIIDAPVYILERGAGGLEGGGLRTSISTVILT